jgi:hypothetical protein
MSSSHRSPVRSQFPGRSQSHGPVTHISLGHARRNARRAAALRCPQPRRPGSPRRRLLALATGVLGAAALLAGPHHAAIGLPPAATSLVAAWVGLLGW